MREMCIRRSVLMSHDEAINVYRNINSLAKNHIVCGEFCGAFQFTGEKQDIFRIEAFIKTPYISRFYLVRVKPEGYNEFSYDPVFGAIKTTYCTFIDMQGHVRIAFSFPEALKLFNNVMEE